MAPKYPSEAHEREQFVQSFREDFAALVRRYFPTTYTHTDLDLLVRCHEVCDVYSIYVWDEKYAPRVVAAEASTHVRAAVKALVKAEIADSWKGGGDPEDIPGIEEDLRRARQKFDAALIRFVSAPRLEK